MTLHYRPLVERLETRLLLTSGVVEPVNALLENAMVENAMVGDIVIEDVVQQDVMAEDVMAMPDDLPPLIVSVEPQDASILVVLGLTEPGHASHFVSVIDGPSAWTDADGYVRLQIPTSSRLVELEITNDQGVTYSTLRLELDDSGHLTSQMWEARDELAGEGESDRLASMIGSMLDRDSHASMSMAMPGMTMDTHPTLHVAGVSAATLVSHATTHAFDFATTRSRMSDHSPITPSDVAARANSSDDAPDGATDDSGSMGAAEHGGAGGSMNADGDGDASHESEVAGDEPAWESASFAGNELAAVSPSLVATLMAEDGANAPKLADAATYAMGQTPQTPPTQPTTDTTDMAEDSATEPAKLLDQDVSQERRTWFVLKIAATSLLSAAAAVFFERRAHSIARATTSSTKPAS